jgi:hypothetical protein
VVTGEAFSTGDVQRERTGVNFAPSLAPFRKPGSVSMEPCCYSFYGRRRSVDKVTR